MLGAIIGDVVGSVYEFNNYRRKDFQPFYHLKSAFTDDTVCTIAVADALLNDKCPAQSLKEWGLRYWDNGGWGRSFALWLGSESLEPYGSYGNGAAMRVAPAGFLAKTLDDAIQFSGQVTQVTHDHPEGMKGAAATAAAIFMAKTGSKAAEIRGYVSQTFDYDLSRSVDAIRPDYVFNETCQQTVPEALICALSANDFEDAIRNAISIGGDSDTVAAIAGGVAEALFGVPDHLIAPVWKKLPSDMRQILVNLYGH